MAIVTDKWVAARTFRGIWEQKNHGKSSEGEQQSP